MGKAVIYRKTGSASVLEFIQDHELPSRKPGEVRVSVKSTSFNPIDAKTWSGIPGRELILPKVPGGDVAGLIVEADAGSKFKAGDAVIGHTNGSSGSVPNGAWQEFANIPEEWVVKAPPNLSLEEEAGAIPIVSITAFQALETCNLKPGDRVLIHAGSGGVGHMAVQLAKQHWKAYVVSTSRNVDFVKSIGADEVLDYTKEDFAEKYKDQPFDAIVDAVLGDTELKSYPLVKKGGTYAHIRCTNVTDMKRVEEGKKWTDKRFTFTIAKQNGKHLAIIADLIAEGKVRPYVSDVIPLEKAREAEEIASKKRFGKVVIRI